MATGLTALGDIGYNTGIHVSANMIKNGLPYVCFEPFGQAEKMPKNKGATIRWIGWDPLDPTPTPLAEGVTPLAQKMSKRSVSADLVQLGSVVEITDVIEDTHEDPVLKIACRELGVQYVEMVERFRFGELKAGTNVHRAGDVASRDLITEKVSVDLMRRVRRTMRRNRAKPVTEIVDSTPNFNTVNIHRCYPVLAHPDLETDIEALPGFKHVEDYGKASPWPNEIGAWSIFRFLLTDILEPWADAGGAVDGSQMSTTGTNCDVYPMFICAENAYGIVSLAGHLAKNSNGKMEPVLPAIPFVHNPSKSTKSDMLGQKGGAGFKTWAAAKILQDLWFVRAEVAVSK